MKKRMVSILLTLAMVLTLIPALAVGTGAAAPNVTASGGTDAKANTKANTGLSDKDGDGYYELSTESDLNLLRAHVNGGGAPINVELMNDIWSSSPEWTPIGTVENPYSGHFDGKGYTIGALSIAKSFGKDGEVAGLNPGFFGNIENAGIRNLRVAGRITATNTLISGEDSYIAGNGLLVGVMKDSILDHCYAEGTMEDTGAVTGLLVGVAQHSIIVNCGTRGTINSSSNYVGGIVGYMTAGYDVPLCLLNSYSIANITSKVNGYTGGLAGALSDDAINNYFGGTVKTTSTSNVVAALFAYVGNSIIESDLSTSSTFTPVIEKNYYLSGSAASALGSVATGLNSSAYATSYTSNASLVAALRSNLSLVENVIDGHRGYLSTSAWAHLVSALDGAAVVAKCWTASTLVSDHVTHSCTESTSTAGTCDACGSPIVLDPLAILYSRSGNPIAYYDIISLKNDAVSDAAANSGSVLKIARDFTWAYYEWEFDGVTVTIDLCGNTIDAGNKPQHFFKLYNGANVTVLDSVGGGKVINNMPQYGGAFYLKNASTLTLENVELISTNYVLWIDSGTAVVRGGSIQSTEDDDFYCYGSIRLELPDGKTTGTLFPGGLSLYNPSLENVLGDGLAYYVGGKRVNISRDQKSITGGDVTVGVCDHTNADKDYTGSTYTQTTHTFTFKCCGAAGTEAHVSGEHGCAHCGQVVHNFSSGSNGFCTVCDLYEAPSGTGTAADPYRIANAGQLFWFAKHVKTTDATVHAVLTANIDVNPDYVFASDGTVKKNGSVVTSGFRTWTPIGSPGGRYSGTFDGAGYTVRGIYFNKINAHIDNYYIGFFGYVENGRVENLTLTNAYIRGYLNVGGIVGRNDGGTVENCHTNADVAAQEDDLGGVVGYNDAGFIINCSNTGTVQGRNSYSECVGGIVGVNDGGLVVNSYNVGSVSGYSNVGGAVGNTIAGGVLRNLYYLDTCGSENTNGTAMSQAAFASGEVAYLLSSGCDASGTFYAGTLWGQDIDNGKSVQTLPSVTGASVYALAYCDGSSSTAYSNSITGAIHVGDDYSANGFCPRCGAFEPAVLVDGVYQIGNAGNLFWFAEQVNGGSNAVSGILTADIDLEGRPWTPMGTEGSGDGDGFRGVFDGAGHSIVGLNVTASDHGVGFIGEIRNGIARNFTLYGNVYLNAKYDYVGGVIGSACGTSGDTGSTISGITSYVNVTLGEGADGANPHGANRVAGLIGYVNHKTNVENCAWYGTLDLDVYRAQDGVGGLIGKAGNSYSGKISNCAAYGTIITAYKSNTYKEYDTIYIGGILSNSVAAAKTVIENCLWAGTIVNDTDLADKNAHLSSVGTMNGYARISGCYALNNTLYITTNGAHDESITSVTTAQLLSGEIAYVLGSAWGQTLGEDAFPVLGGKVVLFDGEVYYNEILSCDINGDDIVDIADIVAVINAASGAVLDCAVYPGNPDITGDGVVDIADIVAVINIASGMAV